MSIVVYGVYHDHEARPASLWSTREKAEFELQLLKDARIPKFDTLVVEPVIIT